ncbi:hypothetical protein FHL15_002039 [Xylaria flabelliformis]|uniref:Glycosylphosphatidylinositol anchor biosynthesis protein 11 n=1 Tax=Xylaria flabelliformis TaxID=2512241 RepID=A0A553IAL8_9PEZI|nr:hypothetical protein FHL15_002039 [Xylaria flabelliformis]
MASNNSSNMIDPAIIEYLKAHGEEEIEVGDRLHQISAALNRNISTCQGLLSRIHSTPSSKLPPLLKQIEETGIQPEIEGVGELAQFASKYPYYKYNNKWSRSVQNVVGTILLTGWLGGMGTESRPGELGRLLTIEDVGEILRVPVNLKDRDAFHITIEEYLLALTDITEELSRLAMNSVTLGDVALTVRISSFIKDLFAGFQLLNLKNDIVRKRVDAVKYHVKKVEDVIYDLSLRNLLPKADMSQTSGKGVPAQELAKPKETDAPMQAVRTIPSPEAQALRHAHPAVLLALFAIRFRALVADPVSTMQSSLPVILALQAAYTVTCLPAAGSQGAKTFRKLRPGEKKKTGSETAGPNLAVTSLVAFVLTIVSAGALHVLLVLFGAPFLTHLPHTFLCSLHLSLLGLYPLFYTRGVAGSDWTEILGARAPFDEAFGGLVGAGLGAWLGAVPIPLDWDREWQKWPVTILCGIYAGYTVGKLIGGTIAFGKRFGEIETS